KWIRADTVHRGAALRDQIEAIGVGARSADRQRDLPARYRQGLHERARRGFPKPVSDLIVKGFDVVRLDDTRVVAQTVIELRAIGLRVDRLEFVPPVYVV